jgi:hypothetical protein
VFAGHHDTSEMSQIFHKDDDMGENKKDKRLPAKVAWYFPIIPHLK